MRIDGCKTMQGTKRQTLRSSVRWGEYIVVHLVLPADIGTGTQNQPKPLN
jgi:hypothetical protein